MTRLKLIVSGLALIPSFAFGCGLDWTLPHVHFDGVESHGYVAYWEKIGDVDLGDGLVLPVHINFNSHREASSPTLGKGWLVPLLESHVEPIDENSLHVIMPDGWTFLFYRNDNTAIWRGNSGWVGETDGTRFTITAPCGWKIKYNEGKIREIDTGQNRTLTWLYSGGIATAIDADGKPFLEIENDPTTGIAQSLKIGDQVIALSHDKRPRIEFANNQNLVAGFDPAISELQWPGGKKETFTYEVDKEIDPTLAIAETNRPDWNFTWNARTRKIISDGTWTYTLRLSGDHFRFDRTLSDGETESFESDDAKGMTLEKSTDGPAIETYRFPSGPLTGRLRKIVEADQKPPKVLYSASYFPSGRLMRETVYPDHVRTYSENGKLLKETMDGDVLYQQDFDAQGHLVHLINPGKQIEVKSTYDSQGACVTQVFRDGKLFYAEQLDKNNRLISLNEGTE